MKDGCISHPTSEPLIIIRKWQIEFCDGNQCAAALLSFFEYWHNIKLEQSAKAKQYNKVSQMHGEPSTQDESLWQWHTEQDLEAGILIYRRESIAKALDLLKDKGIITISRNPNPAYKFDRTRWFLLNTEAINIWLDAHYRKTDNRSRENLQSMSVFRSSSSENRPPSPENRVTISEITSEITNRENKEIRDIANLAVWAPTQENLFPSQSENLSDNSTQNSTQPTSQKASSKKSSAGKKESVADPRFNHPGLVAIREIIAESGSKEFPNKLVWDDLITVLGDNPDTAKLRQCAKSWLLKDYRIGNLAWVTEWYKNGIPLADWKKQQQTTSASSTTNQQPQQQPVPTCKEQITDRDAFIAFSNTEQFKNNPDALFDLIINAPVNLVAYCLFNPLPKDSIAKLPEAHKAVYESSKRGYLNYARTYAPKTYAQVVNY